MEHPWRCLNCRTLLGVERSGRLHLRYKQAQFVVAGEVLAVCTKCGRVNERTTDRPPGGPAPTTATAA